MSNEECEAPGLIVSVADHYYGTPFYNAGKPLKRWRREPLHCDNRNASPPKIAEDVVEFYGGVSTTQLTPPSETVRWWNCGVGCRFSQAPDNSSGDLHRRVDSGRQAVAIKIPNASKLGARSNLRSQDSGKVPDTD